MNLQWIACFGDSLIQGFPFNKNYSWIAEVEKHENIKMLNYGLCGDCCDDIFMRMKNTMLPEYIRHIIFFGGANDLLQKRPQKVILEDLNSVYLWSMQNHYKLCIVLPWISGDSKFNVYLQELKKQIQDNLADKCYLLDVQSAIGTSSAELQKAYLDCVHPTSATYKNIGAYAAPLIKEWVEK